MLVVGDGHLCHADVRRVLDKAVDRQYRRRVRVRQSAAAYCGVSAYGECARNGFGETFLEGDGHSYHFHYRARFVCLDASVESLDISGSGGFFVQFQVGYCLYVAGGDFHQHRGAPFGLGVQQHLAEFVLKDVLHGDVDGGVHVVAVYGGYCNIILGASVGQTAVCYAGCAVQQRIQCAFEARASVYGRVYGGLADAADAKTCHFAEWIGAFHHRLYFKAGLVRFSEIAEKREFFYAVHSFLRHGLAYNEVAGAFAFWPVHLFLYFLQPFLLCTLGETCGQRIGQLRYCLAELDNLEAVGAQVHHYVEVVQVCCEDAAVGRKYLSAEGFHHAGVGKASVAHRHPGIAVQHCCAEQLGGDCNCDYS